MLIRDQGCFPSHEHQRGAVYTHAHKHARTRARTRRDTNSKIVSVCNTCSRQRSLRRCVHAFELDVINSRGAPCLEGWNAHKRFLFFFCIWHARKGFSTHYKYDYLQINCQLMGGCFCFCCCLLLLLANFTLCILIPEMEQQQLTKKVQLDIYCYTLHKQNFYI